MAETNKNESQTEICTSPCDALKEFSMADVEFTLRYDTSKKHVSLKNLELRLILPTRRFVPARICPVSNDYYLISDYSTNCIIKLKLSSGEIKDFRPMSGDVEGLFFLKDSKAAVAIKDKSLHYIFVLETEHNLRPDHFFLIADRCVGVAHVKQNIYVGQFQFIAIYNDSGKKKKEIFKQVKNNIIWFMTKGPQNTLICSVGSLSNWSLKVINTKGDILKDIFRYNTESRLLPSLFLSEVLTDLEENVYLQNRYVCLKVTPKGKVEKFDFPEEDIVAVCYDASIDMLVFLFPDFLVLKSPNASQETNMYKIGLEKELKITTIYEGHFLRL